MKKLMLLFTVLMITLAVTAQKDVHVKAYRSITVEEGVKGVHVQDEDFTFHIDRKNSILRVSRKAGTTYFKYSAKEYFQKDGFTSMVGYAKERDTGDILVIQIDFSDSDDNMVKLTLSDGDLYSTYVGYTY